MAQTSEATSVDLTPLPCPLRNISELSSSYQLMASSSLMCSNMNNRVIPKRRCKMYPPMKVVTATISNSPTGQLSGQSDEEDGAKPTRILISPVVKRLKTVSKTAKIHHRAILSKSPRDQSYEFLRIRSKKACPGQEICKGSLLNGPHKEDHNISGSICNLSQGLIAGLHDVSRNHSVCRRVENVNSLGDACDLDSVLGAPVCEEAKSLFSSVCVGRVDTHPLLPLTSHADFIHDDNKFGHNISPLKSFEAFPWIAEKPTQAKGMNSESLSDTIYQRDVNDQTGWGTAHASLNKDKRRCENVCGVCEKVFALGSDLRKHKIIHENLRPFKCSICGKGFNSLSTRNSHQKVHVDDRPYRCSHCDMTFKKSHNRTVHERKHTGDRPHICMMCRRAFAAKSSLKRHFKCHELDKNCVCQWDGMFYTGCPVAAKPHMEQYLSNGTEHETSGKAHEKH